MWYNLFLYSGSIASCICVLLYVAVTTSESLARDAAVTVLWRTGRTCVVTKDVA
jgi:hypothetical protein